MGIVIEKQNIILALMNWINSIKFENIRRVQSSISRKILFKNFNKQNSFLNLEISESQNLLILCYLVVMSRSRL
ncbi:unnamed protein product [Paramecium octaurelia]|uniref:Uncharacterized protein n=1 Tax=Paramecium octaurelia TaxID=43137 RepID=A0A8S1VWP1_PAROT|nr:unnamed protein product [Paramecium octaurelia]